jgi:hypothetical protein
MGVGGQDAIGDLRAANAAADAVAINVVQESGGERAYTSLPPHAF